MNLYTVVSLRNGGTTRYDHCVADVFDSGVLTISATEDEREIAVHVDWTLAVVFDHNNFIEYAHENRRIAHAA